MKLHFALVGNQNCGKSTLFNYLTGSNQHVGNFPGVTVQKRKVRFSQYRTQALSTCPASTRFLPTPRRKLLRVTCFYTISRTQLSTSLTQLILNAVYIFRCSSLS